MFRKLFTIALLLMGLYAAGSALWQLGNTVIFVCKAQKVPAVVVDATERPFESIFEMLEHGNMPWEGQTAYHPHLRYNLFDRPITDTTLPDLDNRDYANGQQVELLVHPQNTHMRHINEAKFLWLGNLTLLGCGGLMLWLGWRVLRRRGKTGAQRPAKDSGQAPRQQPSAPPASAPPRKRQKKTSSSGKTRGKAKRNAPSKKRCVSSKS